MTGRVSATVPAQRSFGIELLEALLVRGNATVSPYLLALKIQRWADTVITISIVVGARIPVLLVDVRRALAGLPGAHFRKIAFVGRFPAHDATREQLHFQNRSRLDLSRGSKQSKAVIPCGVERREKEILISLSIYPPRPSTHLLSASIYRRVYCTRGYRARTSLGKEGGGRMEAECLTWNVSKMLVRDRNDWRIVESVRRGEERREEEWSGEREEVECRRNILPCNRCSKGRSRIALRRWACRWSDRSKDRTRDTPRSIRNHIALPRRLPCFRMISSLRPEKRWKMRFFERISFN